MSKETRKSSAVVSENIGAREAQTGVPGAAQSARRVRAPMPTTSSTRAELLRQVNSENLDEGRGVTQRGAAYSPRQAIPGDQVERAMPEQPPQQAVAEEPVTPQVAAADTARSRAVEREGLGVAETPPAAAGLGVPNVATETVGERGPEPGEGTEPRPRVTRKSRRSRAPRQAATAAEPGTTTAGESPNELEDSEVPVRAQREAAGTTAIVPTRPTWNTTAGPVWKAPPAETAPRLGERVGDATDSVSGSLRARETAPRALLGPAGISAEEVMELLGDRYSTRPEEIPMTLSGRGSKRAAEMQEADGVRTHRVADGSIEEWLDPDAVQEWMDEYYRWTDADEDEARDSDTLRHMLTYLEGSERLYDARDELTSLLGNVANDRAREEMTSLLGNLAQRRATEEARGRDSYMRQQRLTKDLKLRRRLAAEEQERRDAFIEESIRNNEAFQAHKAKAATARADELRDDLRNGRYEWTGNKAFDNWTTFKAGTSEADMWKRFVRRTGKSGTVFKSIGQNRKAVGGTDYEYGRSVGDNVLKAQEAADATARLVANPLLIRYEGLRIETRPMRGSDKFQARLAFDDNERRNVRGAVMSVMNKYGGISEIEALGLIISRLGLGVDTQGKIGGVKASKYELPALVLMEAANDIVQSQDRYGHPLGIVPGKPHGVAGTGTRDRTGMFPVLGGTRCYPVGYIPRDLFHKLREGRGSALYGVTDREFYRALGNTWLNRTQPVILANTDGPLGWQAAALNMMMEGLMNIDGIPLEAFNVPEYATFRTREMLQADAMQAGETATREAFDAKMEYYPEVMSRWAAEHFKDSRFRSVGTDDDGDADEGADVPRTKVIAPGTQPCGDNFLDDALDWYWSATTIAQALHLGNILTAPLEAALSTSEQQVVVSIQNAYRNHLQRKWGHDGRHATTEYLSSVIRSEDALEALEVAQTLMRIGGRTALDAFRMDYDDRGVGNRYRFTKRDMHDFLERWNADGNAPEALVRLASRLEIGEGIFKRTQAQQFLDMAMYEMTLADINNREYLSTDELEEISRAGGLRKGAGEALVSALLDTQAGYEAFKSIGATSLNRTTAHGRAISYVMHKNGVTNTAVRMLFGNFPEYHMNRLWRMVPLSNTFSYLTSCLIKRGAMTAAQRLEAANELQHGRALRAMEALSRISDYQMGMDVAGTDVSQWSAEDWRSIKSGLYKNLIYDAVTFGGNYIAMSILHSVVLMVLGGIRPPEDDDKLTLAEEWVINNLNVPVKMSWFMDDLLGCGAPLSYAWLVSMGYDRRDGDGNVIEHVEGGSEKANQTACSVFLNMVRSLNNPGHIVSAIDFVTNFHKNMTDLAEHHLVPKDVREYYDGEDRTEDELRGEWAAAQLQGLCYDLFGNLTPPILNEILPGARDSLWSDEWQHDTSKRYADEKYGHERAVNEDRTDRVTFLEHSRMEKTQDNVISAFLNDLLRARDGIEYQYANMPIRTTGDPRYLSSNSYEERFGLNLELADGTKNLDLDDDGITDTLDERQEILFDRAEELCEFLTDDYVMSGKYPELAAAEGLVIPADARLNAINYCYYMIGDTGKIWTDFYERKEREGYQPDSVYRAAQEEEARYKNLLYNWLKSEDIPWRAPRYGYLRTSYGTMYLDEEGNATNAFAPGARAESYAYGDGPGGIAPFTSPRMTGVYDYGSPTWDTQLDASGNPVNEDRIYDEAREAGTVGEYARREWRDRDVIDIMTADGALGDGDRPTLDVRDLRGLEATMPGYISDPTSQDILGMLGINSYLPGDETNLSDGKDRQKSGGGDDYDDRGSNWVDYPKRGYTQYPRRTYSYGGGYTSGRYSTYSPKIYSTSRNVSGSRAAGLSTRSPYKATTTYLHPSYYTKGSSEAYKRSDI